MKQNMEKLGSDPKRRKIEPFYIVVMAVVAALPFLLVRLFGPGAATGDGTKAPAPALAMNVPDEGAAWAAETLAGLTLEKKIAQLVTSDIAGGYIAAGDPRLERWLSLARDHGLGMFVLYGGTPRDAAHLLNRLQGARASSRPTWPSPRPARRTSCTGPPRPRPSRAGPWAST
ncbi:MAG: hypothetical protein MUE80_07780 [Acidobacteria bacterium]|nr:hypothetical protein [Acidobacteriota bacterium]